MSGARQWWTQRRYRASTVDLGLPFASNAVSDTCTSPLRAPVTDALQDRALALSEPAVSSAY